MMQPDELRAARETVGMTQQAFADALGMSRKAINEMEAGKSRIELRTALAARQILDRYSVEPMADGRYGVVRRSIRSRDRASAMISIHGETRLLGLFTRRDHAYRWAVALQNSALPPRDNRALAAERAVADR